MDELELIADEWGLFTAARAAEAGIAAATLARLRRTGQVTRLTRGWYAVTPPGVPLTPARRHAVLALASARSLQLPTVLSHHSELAWRGLPLYGAPLDEVHLSLVDDAHWPRSRGRVRLHRDWAGGLDAQGRMPVAAAIAQAGTVAGPVTALVAADAALARSLTTRAELREAGSLVRGRRHGAVIPAILEQADGRSQSVGETRLRHIFHLAGLAVVPQWRIDAAGFTAYCDLGVEGEWVVAEFDGRVKYGRSADATDGWRSGADELFAEKRREDAIRWLGYDVVRYVWTDLDRPVMCVRRMVDAIGRSRARRGPRVG